MDEKDRIIEKLLEKAYESDDPEYVEKCARDVLRCDEENTDALVLLADALEDPADKIPLLQKAQSLMEQAMERPPLSEELDEENDAFYLSILQRLAFSFFSNDQSEEALDVVETALDLAPGQLLGKTLYYRILLDLKQYSTILEESLKEPEPFPAMLHSRAIALFKLSGKGSRSDRAFWDAFASDPDIPFYILGYYGEPEDDDEDAIERYHLAMLFEDAWLSEDDTELANRLAGGTILLGLAADLFPPENTDQLFVLADALNIADIAEDIMVRLESRRDWNVLSRLEKIQIALKLLSESESLPSSG